MQLLPGSAPTPAPSPARSTPATSSWRTSSLGSTEPIGEQRKAEIRALLAPLTASLHASRNWEIAVTDELSGLFARRYFETRLAEEWARHRRYESPVSVALFDLDHFKKINDTLGHGAGDMAIRRFGEILRATVRASDLAAATGARSSPCSFPETGSAARPSPSPTACAARSSASASKARASAFQVTVSAGVADTHELLEDERGQLLFRADKALYAAKDEGRNRARLWTDRRRVAARAPLPAELSRRGARAGGETGRRRPAGAGRESRGSRSPPPPTGPTRIRRAHAELAERAAAFPREPAQRIVRSVAHARPAAASSGANGAVPVQTRRARPSRLPHRPQRVGPRPGQAQRDAERLGPRRRRRSPSRRPSRTRAGRRRPRSSGPAFPDRNASSGT